MLDNLPLGVKPESLEGERLFVNSDGVKGGGKRVTRIYPTLSAWEAPAIVYILDEIITKEVFVEHLEVAGLMIGVGMHRAENGGFKGRFRHAKLTWGKSTKMPTLSSSGVAEGDDDGT